MQPLGWYINRLSRMSLPEVGYRLAGSAKARVQRHGWLTAHTVPQPWRVDRPLDWLAQVPAVDPAPYCAAAERILAGRLDVFALEGAELGAPPRWNRDPKTGRDAPLAFGKAIDYRSEALVGDIKYLWEPSRHLQLVTLIQAWRLTGEQRYADGFVAQLDSWLEQCPYLQGAHWTSALELGIRLINWAAAWQLAGGLSSPLFDGPDGRAFRDRWLESVYRHAHFIAGHTSRYSSANNHLLGEAAGVAVAGAVWPFWDELERWAGKARRTLEEEGLAQNAPDGVNREQSTAYQQFVLDFMLLAGTCLRAAGRDFSPHWWQRLEAMLEFSAALMDAGGHLPDIGDADDGLVMRLHPAQTPQRAASQRAASQLAAGALLFGRGDFKRRAGRLDEAAAWLLGAEADRHWRRLPASLAEPPRRRAFPDGGYYVLGTRWETPREVHLVVDAGPLGYLSLAAHGHADALALTLSLGGREFLVDPGTYAYHTQRRWRDYFRGTAAHNTLRVDGEDQSISGGNFMWLRHAQTVCERWHEDARRVTFAGSHDGYLRLDDPVRHRRRVELDRETGQVRVEDFVDAAGEHTVERRWHFAERCEVHAEGGRIVAERDGIRLEIATDAAVEAQVLRGEERAAGGWISCRYDVKEPTTTVVWRQRTRGETLLRSEMNVYFPSADTRDDGDPRVVSLPVRGINAD